MEEQVKKIYDMLASAMPEHYVQNFSEDLEAGIKRHIQPGSLDDFFPAFERCGQEWGYHASHPMATAWMVEIVKLMFKETGTLIGIERCQEAWEHVQEGKPTVMVGNHLSYGDVNYLKALLEIHGLKDFPLMVMAGVKVYETPFRKLMAMAFDTLKMAQPPSRATEDAQVTSRELALITRKVISDALHYQAQQKILYFFPEGGRSRSGSLQKFIPGSARYLDQLDAMVYPVGYQGTEGLMGVGSNEVKTGKISIRVGPGIPGPVLQLGLESLSANLKREHIMNRLGFAVAALLPQFYRGEYEFETQHNEPGMEQARKWLLTEYLPHLD